MDPSTPTSSTTDRRLEDKTPRRGGRRSKSKGRRSSSSPRKRQKKKKNTPSPMSNTIKVSPRRKKEQSPGVKMLNSFSEYPMIGNEAKTPLSVKSHASPTNSIICDTDEVKELPKQPTAPTADLVTHMHRHTEEGSSRQQESHLNETYYRLEDDQKSRYIRKEQQFRAQLMEEENRRGRVHPQRYLTSGTSQYGLQRSYSLSIQTTRTEGSSFDVNDWTPVDSSYGGAFPFCGWIPKTLRQRIEMFLILFAGFAIVYTMVSVATKLTGSRDDYGGASDYNLDDNYFVEAGYDDDDDNEAKAYQTYYDDDDDFYNDGNRFI